MMNKGMIIDIKDNVMTVMSSEGCFQRVKSFPGCYQGMEMVYSDFDILRSNKNKKHTSIIKMFTNAAVAAVIGFAMISSSYIYYDNNIAVYASVTVDVNPSMQFDIGKNNQIVGIHEFNKDAETLLEGLDLKGEQIEQAIKKVEVRLEEKGYFKSKKSNYMLVGYAGVKKSVDMKSLQKKISAVAINAAKSNNISLDVKSIEVSASELKESIDEKTSVGRQVYVIRLKAKGIINKSTNASTAKISNLIKSQNNSVVEVSGVITNVTSSDLDVSPTATPVIVLTPTSTSTTSDNGDSTSTSSPTVNPLNSVSPTPILTPTPTPTITQTPTPSPTPILTPTPTITPSASPSTTVKGDKTKDHTKYKGNKK